MEGLCLNIFSNLFKNHFWNLSSFALAQTPITIAASIFPNLSYVKESCSFSSVNCSLHASQKTILIGLIRQLHFAGFPTGSQLIVFEWLKTIKTIARMCLLWCYELRLIYMCDRRYSCRNQAGKRNCLIAWEIKSPNKTCVSCLCFS